MSNTAQNLNKFTDSPKESRLILPVKSKPSLKIFTDSSFEIKPVLTRCTTVSSPTLTKTFMENISACTSPKAIPEKGISKDPQSKFTDSLESTKSKYCLKEIYEIDFDSEIPKLEWCAYCKGDMSTVIDYKNSSKTFWSSVGIFMLGGICGCFLLPYMINNCKHPQVLCSKCGHRLH